MIDPYACGIGETLDSSNLSELQLLDIRAKLSRRGMSLIKVSGNIFRVTKD